MQEVILQMAQKAINDTVGLDGIVSILLVFGVYPRIVKSLPLLPNIIVRAEAIKRNEDFNNVFIAIVEDDSNITIAFITHKEKLDIELAYKLRAEGKITTLGKLFKESD
ncbi:hypothetical protein LCER1_G002697 [Lachnellula cervina]|uniref:Uncharacterized protein n=1 Tax=Lachnellula cervina TaxID=1316786 RepID=A0A7D8YU18_9HELO|nr:hypothetical protein LCER1_G002697 [Lachnellula cervina]